MAGSSSYGRILVSLKPVMIHSWGEVFNCNDQPGKQTRAKASFAILHDDFSLCDPKNNRTRTILKVVDTKFSTPVIRVILFFFFLIPIHFQPLHSRVSNRLLIFNKPDERKTKSVKVFERGSDRFSIRSRQIRNEKTIVSKEDAEEGNGVDSKKKQPTDLST